MKPPVDVDTPHRVVAVIVCYAPDASLLSRVLAATQLQVEHVVIVDNGEQHGLDSIEWTSHVSYVDMVGNVGVAAAQNAGIRRAFKLHATHVLLLDHDSVPAPGMTTALFEAWQALRQTGARVATIGANYRDPRRPDVSPFIRIDGLHLRRIDFDGMNRIVPVSYVISSGSLISREAVDAVGLMNEPLFIDYIDIEWGLRARAMGWQCFGSFDANLEHALGDAPMKLFGKSYPLRSPLRHYYMVRNAVWLLTRSQLPNDWKIVESFRLLRRAVAYAIFAPKQHLHVAAMFRGLADGLRGRMGKAS